MELLKRGVSIHAPAISGRLKDEAVQDGVHHTQHTIHPYDPAGRLVKVDYAMMMNAYANQGPPM